MPSPIIAIPRRMNYGRPQITRLGPWQRGMAFNYSGEGLGSSALPLACNVDVLPNGELRQRKPIRQLSGKFIYSTSGSTVDATLQAAVNAGNALVLPQLVYYASIGGGFVGVLVCTFKDGGSGLSYITFTNINSGYLIAKVSLGATTTTVGNLVYYNGSVWGVRASTGSPNNVIFSIAGNNPSGGSTDHQGINGGTQSGYNRIYLYKDRLYIFGYGSGVTLGTVYYSKTGDPGTITGDPDAGFFVLSPSGGNPVGSVNCVVGVRNTLYLFTSTTTWALNLPSSGIPTNGVLQIIANIGAFDCVVQGSGRIFVVNTTSVYELYNGIFTDIGVNLQPIFQLELLSDQPDTTQTWWLSATQDKLILTSLPNGVANPDFAGLDTTFDPPLASVLVYNLTSRAWSCYDWKYLTTLTSVTWGWYSYKPVPFYADEVAAGPSVDGATVESGLLWVSYFTSEVHVQPDFVQSQNQLIPWSDHYQGAEHNYVMTIWTQDIEGAGTDTSSWKRYYSVVFNLWLHNKAVGTANATIQVTLTDHNGNDVANATVNFTTTRGKEYYSIKQYTSLRSRHIQYRIVIDPNRTGPMSLLNVDVLAKLKQGDPTAQVSG